MLLHNECVQHVIPSTMNVPRSSQLGKESIFIFQVYGSHTHVHYYIPFMLLVPGHDRFLEGIYLLSIFVPMPKTRNGTAVQSMGLPASCVAQYTLGLPASAESDRYLPR